MAAAFGFPGKTGWQPFASIAVSSVSHGPLHISVDDITLVRAENDGGVRDGLTDFALLMSWRRMDHRRRTHNHFGRGVDRLRMHLTRLNHDLPRSLDDYFTPWLYDSLVSRLNDNSRRRLNHDLAPRFDHDAGRWLDDNFASGLNNNSGWTFNHDFAPRLDHDTGRPFDNNLSLWFYDHSRWPFDNNLSLWFYDHSRWPFDNNLSLWFYDDSRRLLDDDLTPLFNHDLGRGFDEHGRRGCRNHDYWRTDDSGRRGRNMDHADASTLDDTSTGREA